MSKGKSQLKIGIILNYLNICLGNLIPIFYTPIMLRLLGQSEYGLYKLASSVTSYLSLISMGIGSAITRYLIKTREEEGKEAEEKILGLFVTIFQVIAIIAFTLGICLVFGLHVFYGETLASDELQKMRVLVFLMVCNTALSFSVSPFLSLVIAHERYVFRQSMSIITTCITPIMNLIVLFIGLYSIGMATSTLTINLFVNICYLLYIKYNLRIKVRFKKMPIHLLKEIFVFSFWIFVANIVAQLYNSTDTVMIGTVPSLGTNGVAVYNIGGVFNHIVYSLAVGMSALLTPKTNKMVFQGASNTELTDICIRVGRIQSYIISLVITGFIVFGQPFLFYYVGSKYGASYWVAVLMMIPNFIPLVQSVCLSIIVAQNKHRFRSLVYLGIAIANVFGTWFLMRTSLGVIGAALMTGIALIVGQGFVMNWYYDKRTGLEIGRFWKEIAMTFVIPISLCISTLIIKNFVNFYSIPILVIGIITYSIAFFLLSWILVMNKYEKDLFSIPIIRMVYKFRKRV